MLSLEQKELLQKQKAVSILQNREERYMYYGILQEYQLNKHVIQKLEYSKLNPTQHFMFKRVLHGLNVYSKEEITSMHWDKKRRIKKVWKRGQNAINQWKQIISNKKLHSFLKITFGERSSIVRELLNVPVTEVDDSYINKASLKDLGITYEDLILRFMSIGLLPKNFLIVK